MCLKSAFLDYFYIFHFLCYETCLSSHLHTVGLLHSHWNHSSPALNSFNHQCCQDHHYFLKVIKGIFFSFSLSPFGRTLEMMARCISPRWPRPTWPTIPVMPMAMRNCFRPTLFKWMVRNCRKDGIQTKSLSTPSPSELENIGFGFSQWSPSLYCYLHKQRQKLFFFFYADEDLISIQAIKTCTRSNLFYHR